MTNFKQILTGDSKLDRIQANISDAFNSLSGSPIPGGSLITGISLVGDTPKTLTHGLGKKPQVWLLCDFTSVVDPSITMNSYTPSGTNSSATPPIFTGTPATLTGSVKSPFVERISWDENTITIKSGTDCTISLWVN